MMKSPENLYDICINVAVADCVSCVSCMSAYKLCNKEYRSLPNNVLFDFYHKMFLDEQLNLLAAELSDLEVFSRVLSVKHQRTKLLKSFQSLFEHRTKIHDELMSSYLNFCKNKNPEDTGAIELGLKIGAFFNEGGHYFNSIDVLNFTETMCNKRNRDITTLQMLLDCYHKRIYAESVYCEFEKAAKTFSSAQKIITELERFNAVPNLAGLYSNFSFLYFARSEYDEAFSWSEKALKLLSDDLPPKIIIEVLRQASKSCVVKRKFDPAGLLIRQAVNLASNLYEIDKHPHYSDTLLDYGFYLLNFDSTKESVPIYEKALSIKKEVFLEHNIHIALALEDLAYALYVHEYSSGHFYKARKNAEHSIRIMQEILPKNHLLRASVNRVKALILEEISLDEGSDPTEQMKYMVEAEQLHTYALTLSLKAFGEKNVQTAKHYGNLGRLYQSMKRYGEAEAMHLQAIAIKEELLGADDYEVGLSAGHLASLYNYHMRRHRDAERLYRRSLDINLRLFGPSYSGLEYDYRGLVHVYTKLIDVPQMVRSAADLREWKALRDKAGPREHDQELVPLREVVDEFFRMCK